MFCKTFAFHLLIDVDDFKLQEVDSYRVVASLVIFTTDCCSACSLAKFRCVFRGCLCSYIMSHDALWGPIATWDNFPAQLILMVKFRFRGQFSSFNLGFSYLQGAIVFVPCRSLTREFKSELFERQIAHHEEGRISRVSFLYICLVSDVFRVSGRCLHLFCLILVAVERGKSYSFDPKPWNSFVIVLSLLFCRRVNVL